MPHRIGTLLAKLVAQVLGSLAKSRLPVFPDLPRLAQTYPDFSRLNLNRGFCPPGSHPAKHAAVISFLWLHTPTHPPAARRHVRPDCRIASPSQSGRWGNTPGFGARIWRVVVNPSMVCILKSIKTHSGWCAAYSASACAPSSHSCTVFAKSASRLLSKRRNSTLSSTINIVISKALSVINRGRRSVAKSVGKGIGRSTDFGYVEVRIFSTWKYVDGGSKSS
jgi:hypothetical protein